MSKYYIYFNNWWGGFFNGSDKCNIEFFKRLFTLTNIKKVTSKDIQNAAIKYFTDDTLTVVTIYPQPLDSSKPKKGKPHVH